ncbi:hypothetical protein KR038_003484 [Drosophila bunnanda]|nr:hypothetical protein KR038_003484 [Drosophila bunnanda]
MVVSESESEVLSDSESRPMSEHQPAIDGYGCDELLQSGSDNKELDSELLKAKETNGKEHSQKSTKLKNPGKNEATGEDINRPLVLEERHSLSIAETKKRRESIYSNELLFIPKELARSELQQRTRTLSRYAKNREYHLRMLKFPVGSGRPRFVAEQMKKARAVDQPNSVQALDGSQLGEPDAAIKNEEETIDEIHEEFQDPNDLPQNMPNLEVEEAVKNILPDDEEISNILFDLVKKEVEENEALEEINRKILQSQRQSVIIANTSRLQHYPYLRWHKPDQVSCKVEMETEVPASYSEFPQSGNIMEVSIGCNQMTEHVEDVQQQDIKPDLPSGQNDPLQSQFQNTATIIYLPQCEATLEVQLQQPPQVVVAEVPVDNSIEAAPRSPGVEGQSTNTVLRQQLMHHIVQPATFCEEVFQSSSSNNNADDRINQNLRQPYFPETFPPGVERQWISQSAADQAFHDQQLHLQQQYLYTQQCQQQQHQQQQLILYHQHQYKIENKVQEMRLVYQRIKCREEEQLHQYGKSLKKIQDERLACERRHAEEKRVFLLKMDQSRKLEEKLRSDKEQLLRQLRSDLKTLELRIADQQRQQKEKALAWSWQQQQHQQQLQLQRQQLLAQQAQPQHQQTHFLHHQQLSQEVETPHGQYMQSQAQPNQEQFLQHQQIVNQQHTLLYDPPAYVYSPAHQESNVNRLQPYRDHLPPNPADSHVGAVGPSLEMSRPVLLPPPPYCPSNNRTLGEAPLPSRKIRHRRLTTDHRSEPYAFPVRAPPPPSAPPPAEYLQFPRNPHINPRAESSHDLEITSVMANYVANYTNRRA